MYTPAASFYLQTNLCCCFGNVTCAFLKKKLLVSILYYQLGTYTH